MKAHTARSRCYGSGQELQNHKHAVNRNFSQFHEPYVVRKLSIREAQICSLGRIGRKTKKIWLSKLFRRKLRIFQLVEREACAYRRNDNFSSTQLHDPYGVGKLSISRAEICNFSSVESKKKLTSFDRANLLNNMFPRSKSVLPCEVRLPQLEVRENLKKGEPKAYSKGGRLLRKTGQRLGGS